jgi:hypothetical protein
MNNVVRQNPWSLMPRLQDEINRLFGNMSENDSSSATAAHGHDREACEGDAAADPDFRVSADAGR